MRRAHRHQSGISLMGLLFWAVILSFTGLVAARTIPTVMEFYTIQHAVDKIARGNPATVPVARAEFERVKQVEYSITSIGAEDLVITKEDDRVRISFAYDKQVELFGPVSLLIKYEGRSH
ncbi:DUF4845 domain-containing protein [Mitsuaria sp. WAJ17]|uniref:DUF4845 domain-containing protein n=1 Tax=Mitsuaria sp. WAJ17 TaxID=2761452 RepID=UPI0016029812|nr:DUF4845 domain-containing protein [Mitsuaria sp. WAJ17]MBB2484260.1 DUF4845 domain-containing protein [Mitsuaria sp. WAJ17]